MKQEANRIGKLGGPALARKMAARSIAPLHIAKKKAPMVMRYASNGYVTYVNDAYCEYFRKDRHSVLGRNFIHRVPLEDVGYVSQAVGSLSPLSPVCRLAHDVTLEDGGLRRHLWIHQAVFNHDGEVKNFVAVGIDITDRKHDPAYMSATVRELTGLLQRLQAAPNRGAGATAGRSSRRLS